MIDCGWQYYELRGARAALIFYILAGWRGFSMPHPVCAAGLVGPAAATRERRPCGPAQRCSLTPWSEVQTFARRTACERAVGSEVTHTYYSPSRRISKARNTRSIIILMGSMATPISGIRGAVSAAARGYTARRAMPSVKRRVWLPCPWLFHLAGLNDGRVSGMAADRSPPMRGSARGRSPTFRAWQCGCFRNWRIRVGHETAVLGLPGHDVPSEASC